MQLFYNMFMKISIASKNFKGAVILWSYMVKHLSKDKEKHHHIHNFLMALHLAHKASIMHGWKKLNLLKISTKPKKPS